jgi:flagellar biosynthesis protein FlhB
VSDGGSHKPTPKRVREFRKRAEIAHSRDLTAVTAMGGAVIGMVVFASRAGAALADFARMTTSAADGRSLDFASEAARTFAIAAGPALIGACVGALVGGLAQLGWPPALKGPSFDLTRAMSFAGLKDAWSPRAAFRRAAVAAAKVAAVAIAVLVVLRGELAKGFVAETPDQIAGRIGGALGRLAFAAGAALAVLAAFDYLLARRRIGTKMKMTPDEIKREHRESEGDPHQKGKRKRRAREIAGRRMVTAVQAADVVVVNPTHYAVALTYQADADGAPKVVAKGADEVAARIREIARQAGVPILSRPPLARALYKVPEGREVPAPLFKAVAEVLAYVYRLRRRVTGVSS